MHPSLAPLKRTLELNARLVPNCLDGVSDELATRRPSAGTNHIAFVALHILDARYYLAAALGVACESPFKERLEGAKGIDDIDVYPSLDDVRDAWNEVSGLLSSRLEVMDEKALDAEAPFSFPIEGGASLLGMLTFLTQHESYHVGQLAFLRRLVGLDAMSYQ